MEMTGTLEALYSKRDTYGNCYWALVYTDHKTGNVVRGTVTGGESNIYGILRHWNAPDDWDRSVVWRITPMGIREFNRLTEDWPHAGCGPEELAAWIRAQLAAPVKTFNEQQNIGHAKYVVNHHDGVKCHPGGSPFFDVHIFGNRRKADAFVRGLRQRGYVER